MKKFAFFVIILIFCAFAVSAYANLDSDYEKALQFYSSGQFEKAADHLKEYVQKRPKSSAYYLIGYSLYKLGRHDEAQEYFKEAYLIDPEFSPASFFNEEIRGKFRGTKEKTSTAPVAQPDISRVEKHAKEALKGAQESPPVVSKTKDTAVKDKVTESPPVKVVEPVQPQIPPVETAEPVQPQAPDISLKTPDIQKEKTIAPEKPRPKRIIQPPLVTKGLPKGMEMPKGANGIMALVGIAGIMSGVVGLIMQIVLYVFTALCLFRIGNMLDVPKSWIAWIPILNGFWPIVGAGGQTVRWGLMYLIGVPILAALVSGIFAMISPILSMLVMLIVGLGVLALYIWLWMNVSENLGKKRLLGLIMIVPLVNLVFMGYLAFTKKEE